MQCHFYPILLVVTKLKQQQQQQYPDTREGGDTDSDQMQGVSEDLQSCFETITYWGTDLLWNES